jgi:glycosyltransferase involved in cell wall biosynthesis
LQTADELPPFGEDWPTRRDEIVTVSNVNTYKRQDLVIRALPRVIEKTGLRELKYRIIGHADDGLTEQLTAVAAEAGVSRNVSLEGRVSLATIEAAMRQAKAAVLMSECESFGIPIIESMAAGTPTIAAAACALPEVAGDGATLSPPGDAEALAESLAKILTDPSHARTLRAAGLARCRTFAWKNTADAMGERLRELGDQA